MITTPTSLCQRLETDSHALRYGEEAQMCYMERVVSDELNEIFGSPFKILKKLYAIVLGLVLKQVF